MTTRETTTENNPNLEIFEDLESDVQSYARSFPVIFDRAEGSYIYDQNGTA